MANDNFSIDDLNIFIDQNSQNDQSSSGSDSLEEEKRKKYEKKRIEQLKRENLTEAELQRQLLADREEIKRYQDEKESRDLKFQLEERIKYGATLKERLEAESHLRDLNRKEELAKKVSRQFTKAGEDLFYKIKGLSKDYADYVERIQVGLIGTEKSYESVTSKLDKVFAMNVFFSMDDALKKTTEMVEQGIAYNVELRSALDVMSDKMAKTFDALDKTLLRMVKIQQEDSTQARLGMENLLLTYLNSNFNDSQYLHNISDQVSALLLETTSRQSKEESVELEYAVQKWLGSFSSIGVSDNTITALARAIGYLGSGDVESLTADQSLQQLIAMSIQRGGGSKSYGEILSSGIDVSDVSSLMSGFYNLVSDISSSGNLVAINQYAKLFGLSMSDITSVMNISSEEIGKIAENMVSYEEALGQVESELTYSNLRSRTAISQMVDNIKSNIFTSMGLDMAENLAANIAYEVADQAASMVDMLEIETQVAPFGIGPKVDIDAGSMIRTALGGVSYFSKLITRLGSLSSVISPDLTALGGEEVNKVEVLGGEGTSSTSGGTNENQVLYVSRSSDKTAVYKTLNQESGDVSSKVITKDVDEESKKMEKMQKNFEEIAKDVDFIVQLLNIDGIVIRDRGSSPSSYQQQQNSTGFYISGGY